MKLKSKAKLILASQSPQRRKLLKKLKIPFQIIPSRVHEGDATRVPGSKARRLVLTLARKKAVAVAKKFKNENCVVLGADTIVICGNKIFGKPKNIAHARRMLGALSGSWQTVITGLCMVRTRPWTIKTGYTETKLLFHRMDEAVIHRLAKKNLDKSGSYSIQKMPDRFVKRMKGPLDNVIGLPVAQVRKLLKI